MKMLLIVRDPVERVISDFMLLKYQQHRIRTDGSVTGGTIEDLLLDKNGKLNKRHQYLSFSSYYVHLKNWYKWFPPEQIHIMESTELVKDPQNLLYGIETFLDIEHAIDENVFFFDEKKGFYCYYKDGSKQCMPDKKGMKHVNASDDLIRQLTNYFEPLNQQFFQLINRTYDW